MNTLDERIRKILDSSDFNDLPFEERGRICKYKAQTQILTLWQTLNKNKQDTTETWRRKQRAWLENCVNTYEREYMEDWK